MSYLPEQKLCIKCKKDNKYFPVFRYRTNKMKIYNFLCTVCYMENYINKNVKTLRFISNKKEQEFNLILEHRYYSQEQYSENYDFISKTEVLDQESLKNVEEKEMEQENLINTMELMDEQLSTMLKNNTYNKQKNPENSNIVSNVKFAKISYV